MKEAALIKHPIIDNSFLPIFEAIFKIGRAHV